MKSYLGLSLALCLALVAASESIAGGRRSSGGCPGGQCGIPSASSSSDIPSPAEGYAWAPVPSHPEQLALTNNGKLLGNYWIATGKYYRYIGGPESPYPLYMDLWDENASKPPFPLPKGDTPAPSPKKSLIHLDNPKCLCGCLARDEFATALVWLRPAVEICSCKDCSLYQKKAALKADPCVECCCGCSQGRPCNCAALAQR